MPDADSCLPICVCRGFAAHLLDLRNHGASTPAGGRAFPPPHTLATAAEDVVRWIDSQLGGRTPDSVFGHSLGGKVTLASLQALQRLGRPLPRQAWVLDSPPGIQPPRAPTQRPNGVGRVVEAVSRIQMPVSDRSEIYKPLSEQNTLPRVCVSRCLTSPSQRSGDQKISRDVALWLANGLQPDPSAGEGRLTWGFYLPGAAEMYESYKATNMWGILEDPVASGLSKDCRRAKGCPSGSAQIASELTAGCVAA